MHGSGEARGGQFEAPASVKQPAGTRPEVTCRRER